MLLRLLLLSAFALVVTPSAFSQCPNLVWADEFDGNTLDANNWSYQIGDGCSINLCGWGNNELQSYQQANAVVANGELLITARNERNGNSNYTSARIRSMDKVDFTYGRIEARIKLPSGGGLWPAFWMLSTDEPYGFWPQSGEIDIMEWVGNQKAKVHGTLHYGQPSPNNSQTGATISSLDGDYGNEYHVYAVEWESDVIRWYIDDYLYSTKTRADLSPQRWPFDHDFHLLLNMAVGGNFGGSVTPGIFPATMNVDYVRLYDGNRPFIIGDRFLTDSGRRGQYSVGNVDAGTSVTWSGPSGVSILSGQGTTTAEVQWISEGGFLTATIETPCGDQILNIEIAPGVFPSESLENFDAVGLATLSFSSGVLTEVQNPAPNAVNSTAIVGRYARDNSSPYDVLVYDVASVLGDVDAYVTSEKQLFIDVYTNAPVGTEILVQLETNAARTSDYPTGRHSRYQSFTTERGQWHRLALKFLDRPDANASSTGIVQIPILFAPGSGSGETFFFDNFDIYEESNTVSTSAVLANGYDLSVAQNPVGDMTNVYISLAQTASTELVLTNNVGQVIQSQNLGIRTPGQHEIAVNTANLTTGIYALTLRAEGEAVKSITIAK
ncbi:MAG: family 16 glycosylhydrolase [Saprospiraceae bacterium]